MQGKLTHHYLSVSIETQCAHCGQALHIDVDSQMKSSVQEQGAAPLVFMPGVDWKTFAGRTIIDAY